MHDKSRLARLSGLSELEGCGEMHSPPLFLLLLPPFHGIKRLGPVTGAEKRRKSGIPEGALHAMLEPRVERPSEAVVEEAQMWYTRDSETESLVSLPQPESLESQLVAQPRTNHLPPGP